MKAAFYVGGLRVHVAGNGPLAHFFFECFDKCRLVFCTLRAAVIREPKAAPLADDKRHLPAKKNWLYK